jgi:hypothetical protein
LKAHTSISLATVQTLSDIKNIQKGKEILATIPLTQHTRAEISLPFSIAACTCITLPGKKNLFFYSIWYEK